MLSWWGDSPQRRLKTNQTGLTGLRAATQNKALSIDNSHNPRRVVTRFFLWEGFMPSQSTRMHIEVSLKIQRKYRENRCKSSISLQCPLWKTAALQWLADSPSISLSYTFYFFEFFSSALIRCSNSGQWPVVSGQQRPNRQIPTVNILRWEILLYQTATRSGNQKRQ